MTSKLQKMVTNVTVFVKGLTPPKTTIAIKNKIKIRTAPTATLDGSASRTMLHWL